MILQGSLISAGDSNEVNWTFVEKKEFLKHIYW